MTVPQISSYPIPGIAFKLMSWVATWSSRKNIDDAGFKAVDAALGLYGTHAIDSSDNIW